jgi:hypothetical protein
MEYIILGLIVFIDFAVLKMKFDRARYGDLILDAGMLFVVMSLFHSSTLLLMVGMVAQLLMSIYLYLNPPKFLMPPKATND